MISIHGIFMIENLEGIVTVPTPGIETRQVLGGIKRLSGVCTCRQCWQWFKWYSLGPKRTKTPDIEGKLRIFNPKRTKPPKLTVCSIERPISTMHMMMHTKYSLLFKFPFLQ